MNREKEVCGVKVIVSNEAYNEYKGTLQEQINELEDQVFYLEEVIDKINKTLESSLSNMQKLVAISILLKKQELLKGSDNNE